MNFDLERMYYAFLNGKVPDVWQKVAYLSLKPLGSWVNNFFDRLNFF